MARGFVTHGWPKLMGGPEMWAKVGEAMSMVGITFAPKAWGLAAGLVEALGGLFVALGFLTRPAAAALVFVMGLAAAHHLKAGDGYGGASHAVEAGLVFLCFFLGGPGKASVDARLFRG